MKLEFRTENLDYAEHVSRRSVFALKHLHVIKMGRDYQHTQFPLKAIRLLRRDR